MKYVYPTTQRVLELPEGRRSVIRCPTTNGDSHPSFTLYADGGFYCFHCGAHGANGIDFLINVLGTTVPEAMQYLNDRKLLTKIE